MNSSSLRSLCLHTLASPKYFFASIRGTPALLKCCTMCSSVPIVAESAQWGLAETGGPGGRGQHNGSWWKWVQVPKRPSRGWGWGGERVGGSKQKAKDSISRTVIVCAFDAQCRKSLPCSVNAAASHGNHNASQSQLVCGRPATLAAQLIGLPSFVNAANALAT